MRKKTTEEFIAEAKTIHGNKYNYSNVNYVGASLCVEIFCLIHGPFQQTPHNHINGKKGCSKCRGVLLQKMFSFSKEKFIEKAKKIHNNNYDYKFVEYVNMHTKVKIICPIHGEFFQTPASHLYRKGNCFYCHREKTYSVNEKILYNMLIINYPWLEIEPNYREHPLLNGLEVDIYLPDIDLAIEWNGAYWHGYKKPKTQYKDKLKKEKLGENLIQITDPGPANLDFVQRIFTEVVKPEIEIRQYLSQMFEPS